MLVFGVLLVLSVSGVHNDEFSARWRCVEDEGEARVSITAEGRIRGRYFVEYCAPVSADVNRWDLNLYTPSQTTMRDPARCNATDGSHVNNNEQHSHSTETIKLDPKENCSYVCFTKSMDLIYSHCYKVYNQLLTKQHRLQPHATMVYIQNDIPGPQYFQNTTQKYKDFREDSTNTISFHFYPGVIPITTYQIDICEHPPKDRTQCGPWRSVSQNCTSEGPLALRCLLQLPAGYYQFSVMHTAPWTSSDKFHNQVHVYENFHTDDSQNEAAGADAGAAARKGVWLWVGCGAAAAAAVLTVAALFTRDGRIRRAFKDAYAGLLHSGANSATEAVAVAEADAEAPRIVVVYARDVEPLHRIVELLVEMLDQVAPGRVTDIHSMETTALAAEGGGAWVRALASDPYTKLLVLQTPLLHRLYADKLVDARDQPTLEAPLLSQAGGVTYLLAQYSDQLAQQLLRLLRETPPKGQPYRNYLFLDVEGVPTPSTFPDIVPWTRYSIPGAAGALLRTLGAPPPHPRILSALADAAREFRLACQGDVTGIEC